MNRILEKIIEPSKIYVGSSFSLKIKVERIQSYDLVTEAEDNIILEGGGNLLTEGDYYE